MLEKKNQITIGIVLSYINIGLGTIIPLFYTPIMLKLMGQAEYGLYGLSNSITSYLSLLTLGIGTAVLRYIMKYKVENNKDKINKILGLLVLIYLFIGTLILICSVILSLNVETWFAKGLSLLEINKLKILIILLAIGMIIALFVSIFSTVVTAYEHFVFRYSYDIIGSIALPIINLIVLSQGFASVGIACVSIGMQFIALFVYILYIRYKFDLHPVFKDLPTHLLKELYSFSIFIFISSLADMLFWAADKVLLGAMIGTVCVAVYNVGGTFTLMLQNLSLAISNVFAPKVNQLYFEGKDISENSKLLIKIGRIQYYVAILIVSGFIVYGKSFITFWAGEDYLPAHYVSVITMIPLIIPLIQNVAYNTIVAMNKHQFRSYMYVCIAFLNLIATYLVIPHYGIIGAAACTALAYILGQGICLNIYYLKVIKLDIINFWKNILKLTIIPLVMIVACSLIYQFYELHSLIELLCHAVVYALIYFGACYVFTFNDNEKGLANSILKQVKGKLVHK